MRIGVHSVVRTRAVREQRKARVRRIKGRRAAPDIRRKELRIQPPTPALAVSPAVPPTPLESPPAPAPLPSPAAPAAPAAPVSPHVAGVPPSRNGLESTQPRPTLNTPA